MSTTSIDVSAEFLALADRFDQLVSHDRDDGHDEVLRLSVQAGRLCHAGRDRCVLLRGVMFTEIPPTTLDPRSAQVAEFAGRCVWNTVVAAIDRMALPSMPPRIGAVESRITSVTDDGIVQSRQTWPASRWRDRAADFSRVCRLLASGVDRRERVAAEVEVADADLTASEQRLVQVLRGRLLSVEELASEQYLDTSVQTVRNWVSSIRRKRDREFIKTVTNRGYVLRDSPPEAEPVVPARRKRRITTS